MNEIGNLLAEFEQEQKKALEEAKLKIQNSEKLPSEEWTQRIIEKVKISELASEFGLKKCPECDYALQLDDSRGWFICAKAKYNRSCNFKGNIVDFLKVMG